MDKMLLKRAAFQSVALMFTVVTLSFALRQNQVVTISASDDNYGTEAYRASSDGQKTGSETSEGFINAAVVQEDEHSQTSTKITVFPGEEQQVDNTIYNQLGSRYLIIKKPIGSNLKIALDDLYISKSVRVTISGYDQAEMDSSFIGRVNERDSFVGDPKFKEVSSSKEVDGKMQTVINKDYGKDIVHGITITSSTSEGTGLISTELLFELDSVYAYVIQEDENYYYISLKNPREVYDRILVIDAGHGGKDAGALSKNKAVYEKDINVKILLALKELLDKENIKVYYTRLGDDKVFLRPRVELANAVDCDFFISIHCNANDVTWPNGTEILYYDKEYHKIKNKALADLFSKELNKTTTLENNGLVEKYDNDIFILENAVVPSVLIEVGYITNQMDMEYLLEDKNRKAVAQGIYNAIMKAYEQYRPDRKQNN